MIIKRKLFTKYDDTDNLKRMKDSDILAEKPKQAPGYGSVAGAALGGAALGGTVGAVAGAGELSVAQGAKPARICKWPWPFYPPPGESHGATARGGV